LEKILKQVWELAFTNYAEEDHSEEQRRESGRRDLEVHRQLISALEKRDGETARKVITEHILNDVMPSTLSHFASDDGAEQRSD
jgi:DNA-binding GntR family transcriptional regulator